VTTSHILATRPEPQQSELLEALAGLGPAVVSMPAFRFEAVPTPSDLVDRAEGALLIFTSPRAVSFGLAALGGVLPSAAQAAAIGPATRAELAQQGIAALQAPGRRHDSEALLAALDGQSPGPVLIFAAPGGRKALERGLGERGWQVTFAPVYRRVSQSPDPGEASRLAKAGGVLSLWTSGTAMSELLHGLPGPARAAVLGGAAIVASDRLALLARDLGFDAVVTAEGASNAALTAAARSYLGSGES
jgi:uroporphyrinogen-III synthase